MSTFGNLSPLGINACLYFVVSMEKRDWCSINYNVHASFPGQLPPPTVADAELHSYSPTLCFYQFLIPWVEQACLIIEAVV